MYCLNRFVAVLLGVKPRGDVHAMNHADRLNRTQQEFIGVESICLYRGEQIDGKPI
ncbi:MAG: hypothetical protein LM583_05780 [Desulfurococcaceae archaeon]|nr:hypothetical protein [Desulfurococcaceae archaeon]